ncbi:MAG: HlyD family efflux transporter periplasmic adaptor subunit [Oscillospiraceae bacterium]
MEVKEKSKKRELIKTIAIVFLVILMALTFFSNTIMNRSLPEVATQSISSGTINAKIRGSGTVAANESYEVIINQTREVRSVCVKVGDTVSQGDLLFVLGDMESSELKSAQEQLDSLNLQYQQQLLTLSKEYAGDDRAIQVLREDLNKAVAQRDASLVTDAEISLAKGDLEAEKRNLTQTGLRLEELKEYTSGLDEAQAAVTKWESAVESAQSAVQNYEDQLDQLETSGSPDSSRAIEDAKDELAQAQYTWRSQWMAYAGDLGALVDVIWAADNPPVTKPNTSGSTPRAIGEEQQVYIDAYLTRNSTSASTKTGTEDEQQTESDAPSAQDIDSDVLQKGKTAYTALVNAQDDVAAKERTLKRLEEDAYDLYGSAMQARKALEAKLSDAVNELTGAQRSLREAQNALQQAQVVDTALKQQIKDAEATQREQSAQVEALTQTLTDLEAKKELYDRAVELVTEKERAIEDALSGKDIDKQLDNLNLQELRKQIERAQELVDKYTQESVDTEVTANVSGLVNAINVSAGKETAAGSAMAVIDVVDQGYIVKIPVTGEQAKQVKVGDTASVTNYYWGNNVEATLEAITADPANPSKGKLLVFRVTGDVDAGSNLTLSIGQRSANYDTIIPKSALREDTNGYFVLVITVKSSPLSNRYIATRVNVQLLAEDDTSAAVSGLSAGDFVVTTSSKPVEPGTQVRMVENS